MRRDYTLTAMSDDDDWLAKLRADPVDEATRSAFQLPR
jgi:hypothetical protein